ncbi:DUF6111 family protein [Roseibium suaedae]|uniref:Uncharacterized protein n=1 Tax=Roseibium suaedae TaxID=735517 RepID=A0A1M7HSY5_9HYPH|nr:DUF6111 family protein [Roseibium suaedae]SHM31584.1 hypothetical protein SAMN05444272_2318 [Roseibium suaedae]
MLRVVLSHVLLFLLPFMGYALWLWLQKKEQTSEEWRKGPLRWLALAGIALVLVSLGLFASYREAPDGAEYIPSHMEDGVFVPGRYQ